ncbi:hypothetical protein M885DRAFT_451953 [Pelagophyceae sp. CCMP2097]|nr:hypothetical protein M885DRAFT_451953 [Pelagophyceae sp. CCMP2097]
MRGFEGVAFDVCAAAPARELVNDADRVSAILAPLLALDAAKVTQVKLSNKSYSADAAELMAEALNTLTAVDHVDIADVIAGRPEAEALSRPAASRTALSAGKGVIMPRAADLTYIDVSDNALGQKGLDALLPLLRSRKLRTLNVCNNGMSADAANQLADLVVPAAGETVLESLQYYNNMSADGGADGVARIVASSPLMRDLRFSGTRTTRAGSLVIAESIAAHLTHLVTLDLADNLFGVNGAALLAAAIRKCPQLASLNLRDCSLTDAGAGRDRFTPPGFALVSGAVVESASPLTKLDVSGNELTRAANWRPLVASTAATLEYLGAEENEFGNGGARRLAAALLASPPLRLATLLLASNEIADRGATALAAALAPLAALATLEFNGNALGDDALEAFTSLFADVLGEMDDNDPDLADGDDDDDDDEEDDAAEADTGDDGGLDLGKLNI